MPVFGDADDPECPGEGEEPPADRIIESERLNGRFVNEYGIGVGGASPRSTETISTSNCAGPTTMLGSGV